MSKLATYNVHFGPDHTVTVLAADKASATAVALAHFRTQTGVPGWTRIPRKVEVVA
jgi:hypothetical protein